MDFLSTWDDSTAMLLQESFRQGNDKMFRAVTHALIFSEKVYFTSNGSSNYKSLPPPPTPAPSLAPLTPAVGRALPTAAQRLTMVLLVPVQVSAIFLMMPVKRFERNLGKCELLMDCYKH